MMMAKTQCKDIHECTNSYTDSLLEINWAGAWWNDNQGSQVVKQGRRAGLLPSDVTKKWIDVGIPGRVAHAMVKKHYSDQNFRVDRICRLRAALEDHILEIKRQITERIDINEPEGEREVRRQVLGRPIFRHCLSIPREKKPDLAQPKEGWVGAGNLGSMERADLGYTSEDEEVPQDTKLKRNTQPSFQSLIQEHERHQCERCGDTPAWSRTSGTLMTGDRCNLHSPDRPEESEDRCENCGGGDPPEEWAAVGQQKQVCRPCTEWYLQRAPTSCCWRNDRNRGELARDRIRHILHQVGTGSTERLVSMISNTPIQDRKTSPITHRWSNIFPWGHLRPMLIAATRSVESYKIHQQLDPDPIEIRPEYD